MIETHDVNVWRLVQKLKIDNIAWFVSRFNSFRLQSKNYNVNYKIIIPTGLTICMR